MNNISDIQVKQIRIFKVNQIPYLSLNTPTSIEDILNSFAFSLDTNFREGLRFVKGEYKTKDKNLMLMELTIQPQKIYFSINSNSEDADLFYRELGEFISKHDHYNAFKFDSHIVKTEETCCVADLDIKHEKIFGKDFLNYIKKNMSKTVSNKDANAFLNSFTLRFKYRFNIENSTMKKYGVTFSDKHFIIEPREGSTLEELKYYTVSPTDSTTHLKLLRSIENKFKN